MDPDASIEEQATALYEEMRSIRDLMPLTESALLAEDSLYNSVYNPVWHGCDGSPPLEYLKKAKAKAKEAEAKR